MNRDRHQRIPLLFRKICPSDIDELFVIRTAVTENPITLATLAELGITPESTRAALGNPLDGYLYEVNERIVGFAMADLTSGEFSVIAVRHEFEKQGIGRELLRRTEELLWSAGHRSIWLWTGTDRTARATRLYEGADWATDHVTADRVYMKKLRPCAINRP